MAMDAPGVMKPAPGVTPTRPATAPVAMPTAVGLVSRQVSTRAQVTKPAAAEMWVVVKGSSAPPMAS